ncbi:MAG: HEAT repeat domain-containing protein [Planctomycetes bacterium]|nr:HEAT repeat domain-containing protein [Planctomycetota bacterium]
MNATITTCLLLAALAATGPRATAQERNDELRLQRAILAEDAERDFERARGLYQAIADDESAPAAMRGEAATRLAKVLSKLGRHEEAAAAGERARAWLPKPSADPAQDQAVDAEIRELIEKLRNGTGGTMDLAWYGERAVPALLAVTDAELGLSVVTLLSEVAFRIGGPRVEAWLDSVASGNDPLRRRAVLRGYGRMRPSTPGRVDASRLSAFARDMDAEVRITALELDILGEWPDFLASLGHEDARVRRAAWSRFTDSVGPRSRFGWEQPGFDARAIALYGALAERHREITRDEIAHAMNLCAGGPNSGVNVLLLLRALAEFETFECSGTGNLEVPPDSLATEVVKAARRVATETAGTTRSRIGGLVIRNAVSNWTRASMPQLLELATLGVGFEPTRFVAIAQPKDWSALLVRIGDLKLTDDGLRQLLEKSLRVEIPTSAFAPLRDFVLAQTESRDARTRDFPVLAHALMRLGLFDDEASLAWCEEFLIRGLPQRGVCKGEPQLLDGLRANLSRALLSGDAPARRMLRRRLAVVEGAEFAVLRNQALARIAIDHDVEAAPLFAVAYAHGLATSGIDADLRGGADAFNREARGLQWVLFHGSWTSADRIAVLDRVLQLGTPEVWADFGNFGIGVPAEKRDPALRSVVATHLPGCPNAEQRRRLFRNIVDEDSDAGTVPAARLVWALRDDDPELAREALQLASRCTFDDPNALVAPVTTLLASPDFRIASAAIGTLSKLGGSASWATIAPFLDRPDVAYAAAYSLFALDQERAIAEILARAERRELESAVCSLAKRTLDRRFVPALIAALRSQNESTRTAAKEALDAIEYYVGQTARWQRLLDEAGLDAGTAAEALIKQARSGDQTIRLAAIRSLGTLGKPETLPFLIQLMQDQDAEVKTAAAQALERINAKQ